MQALRSTVDGLRDRWAPLKHTSTFRSTGQITPEEFLSAGDYLVFKFPTWTWASASTPAKAVSYLPADKQYLVTRGVPCHRRLDADFAGSEERMVEGLHDGDGEGWLSTGGDSSEKAKVGDVRALGEKGEVEAEEEEEEIPDMEDEDDEEAIIRDQGPDDGSSPLRTYNIYITYTPYYRTPRLYLSGYTRPTSAATSVPLPPSKMLEDIVGDYKDKTVTLEDFPFFDTPVKMASIHPCKHAPTMKSMLDRSDSALKLQREKLKTAAKQGKAPDSITTKGLEGLVDDTNALSLKEAQQSGSGGTGGEEWEVLQHDAGDDEVSIRVDQYLVVFIKFMASVTPGIEHDFTMGV